MGCSKWPASLRSDDCHADLTCRLYKAFLGFRKGLASVRMVLIKIMGRNKSKSHVNLVP